MSLIKAKITLFLNICHLCSDHSLESNKSNEKCICHRLEMYFYCHKVRGSFLFESQNHYVFVWHKVSISNALHHPCTYFKSWQRKVCNLFLYFRDFWRLDIGKTYQHVNSYKFKYAKLKKKTWSEREQRNQR